MKTQTPRSKCTVTDIRSRLKKKAKTQSSRTDGRYITEFIEQGRFPATLTPPELPLQLHLYDTALILVTRMDPDPEICRHSMMCNMELVQHLVQQVSQKSHLEWLETGAIADPELGIMLGGFTVFRVMTNKAATVNAITTQLHSLGLSGCTELLDCTCSITSPTGIVLPALTTSLYPLAGLTSEWAMLVYDCLIEQLVEV